MPGAAQDITLNWPAETFPKLTLKWLNSETNCVISGAVNPLTYGNKYTILLRRFSGRFVKTEWWATLMIKLSMKTIAYILQLFKKYQIIKNLSPTHKAIFEVLIV